MGEAKGTWDQEMIVRDGMRWTMKPWRCSQDGEMLLPRNALSARLLFVSGRGGLADIKVSNAAILKLVGTGHGLWCAW